MAEQINAQGTSDQQGWRGMRQVRSFLQKLIIVAAAMLLWQSKAHATHAMGGELSYVCLGNNQYRVTLSFYRDCNGITAPTNCTNGLKFNVKSGTCGANFNQCFSNNPVVEIITPICPSEVDRCVSASGTYGVQRYTYTKIVDLSAYASCGGADWLFSWSLCCRNNAITSLSNPGNRELYLDAQLNNSTGLCNSSPSFTNSPTAFYCLGEPISYNPGAVDADGDSLVYALIPARTADAVNIPYRPNYTYDQPIRNNGGANAVILDPLTGTMTVTPNVLQVAVVTYQVKEYRNGVLVGVVTRDVQFVIRACTGNTSPTVTGINGTSNYSMPVCAGTPVSFTVNSNDANAGQVVTMSWNSGIPGGTFTSSGSPFPTGIFTWTPTVANIGNNTFTVHVQDNGCPLSASNDYGFTIQVTPPATDVDAGSDFSVCGPSATMAAVSPYPSVQGTWTVISGSGIFTNNHSRTTTVSGLTQGPNVFQWSVDYGTCGTRADQVTVTSYNPAQTAAAAGPDEDFCLPINSATLAGNTAVAPAVGTWTLVSGTAAITSPNSPTSGITGLGIGPNKFRWTINNGPCGTPTQDEVIITIYNSAQPPANAGADISICTPTSSVTLNGNTAPAPASGIWTSVSGGGTIVDPTNRNTSITGLTVGVHVFRWTISNGPCTPASTSDDVTVKVYDAGSPIATVSPVDDVCLPGTSTLVGSTPIPPATGVWTVVNGPGTIVIASPTSATTTVSGLDIGANVFQWTVNNGPCGGVTSAQVTVSAFDPSVSGAAAGPDKFLCLPTASTSTSTNLAANAPAAPAQGTWTLVSAAGSISIVDIHSATTSVTGLTVGEHKFRWTISNGPCDVTPPNDVVSIFVYDPTAPAANAGSDRELCTPETSVTLDGNAPVFPATGEWTLIAGSGSFFNASDPTTLVTGLAVGVNTFRWKLNNGPCANPESQDDVSITVFNSANPSADAGTDKDLCTSPTTTTSWTLTGSTLIPPATGTWTKVSGTGTIVSPNSSTTLVTGISVGDNIFRWTVSNGTSCANSVTSDDVRIRVFNSANPVADAGVDKDLCSDVNSTALTGSDIILPASGVWTQVSGPGPSVIVTPNSPTTAVTGLGVGVYVFRWTVSNGACDSNGPTEDEVTITVYDSTHPAVTASVDPSSICVPSGANLVTATGTTPISPATGHWTLVSGSGTITSPNSASTTITDMGYGVNVFQWTVMNGPCAFPSNSAQVSISVYNTTMPTADAGDPQTVCMPITSATLAGSAVIAPGTGQWTVISGSGVFVNDTVPGTVVNGLSLGANIFRWTVDNGACTNGPTSSDVTITVVDGNAEQAHAGPDQLLCGTTATTELAANAGVDATGSWSVLPPGTASFVDPNSPTTEVTLPVGVNILVWSLDNVGCGTSSDQVRITVYDPANPDATAAAAETALCTPTTATTLIGSTLVGPATGTWTLESGNGNIVATGSSTTQVNNLGLGNNVFRWTVNNGACDTTFAEVTITVFSGTAQAANAGPGQEICSTTTSVTLAGNNAVPPGQGTWTGPIGITFSPDNHTANATASGLQVGDNILTWTIDNGACGGPTSSQVNIKVFDVDNLSADAGDDQDLCNLTGTTTTLAGSALIYPATGTWTLVSGQGDIVNPTAPGTAVNDLGVGPNVFRWTVSNGACSASPTSDEVTITLFDSTVMGAYPGDDQSLCTPKDSTTMAAVPAPSPAQGTWTLVSGGGFIVDPNDPTTTITDLLVGENVFRWSVTNGVCPVNPPDSLVSIFLFDQDGGAAVAGPNIDLCMPQDTVMAAEPPTFPAQGTWTLVSGSGDIDDIHDPASPISNLAIGENVFEWTVENGPCVDPLSKARMSIFVFDQENETAFAGPDQFLCTPDESTTLAGSELTFPATGVWTRIQGVGTITDAGNPTTTVTGLDLGENIFVWTVDNGPCGSGITTDTVSIFLFDSNPPNAFAGPYQELCSTDTTNLAGSAVDFPAVGTWTVVSGDGVFTNPNSPTTHVTGLTVGTHVFRWTVVSGPCSSSSDDVTVDVYDENNLRADAGDDKKICTPEETVTMAGSVVIPPSVGTWTRLSGTGEITNPNLYNTTVLDLEVGTSVFVWTVDNGNCGSGITTDTMSVEVFDANNPPAYAGQDTSLCTPNTSLRLSGSNVIAPAVGTWTVQQSAGSPVFADEHADTTTVSGLAVGVNILRWTVSNGPCEVGGFDEVTITVFDETNPVADAGPDKDLCTPDTTFIMAGSELIGPATGEWTLVSGQGTITDPSDRETSVTGLAVGENIFQWSVGNGPCGPLSTDQMSIIVYDGEISDAFAGADQQVCTPLTSATLSGSSVTFPATGTWTLVSGQGDINWPDSVTTLVTDLGVGVNVFRWTVDNGPCGVGITSSDVNITLFDLNAPPADAGLDQSFCFPDTSAVMAANTATLPAIGEWSVTQGPTDIAFGDPNDPNTTVTGLSIGENILTWSFDNGQCGFTADNVSIFIFDPADSIAYAGPDQYHCTPQDSTYLEGNLPVFPASGTWSVIDGAGLFADASDPVTKVVGMAIGANTFVWTTSNGPCLDPIRSDTVTVTIYSDSTAAADAGEDFQLCLPLTSAPLQAATPQPPATGSWSVLSGFGTLVDPTDPTTIINDLNTGITTLLWTLDNGPCPNNGLMTDTLTITIYDPSGPVAFAGPDSSLCMPADSTVMAADPLLFPATGTWHLVSGTGTIADSTDHATAITGLSIGINVFTWTVYNGNCFGGPTMDTVAISVYDNNAAAADAGPDQDICGTDPGATLSGNDATFPGIGTWTQVGGSAIIANANDPQTSVSGTEVGDNIFVWSIDNGPCGTSSDTVLLRVFDSNLPQPDAGEDQDLCSPITSTLMAASTATYPSTGQWSVVSGSGTFAEASDPTTDVSDIGAGVNVYAWTIDNGPCGALVDSVSVTLYDGSVNSAFAGDDQNICGPVESTPLAATGVTAPATGYWTIISGDGTVNDPADPNATLGGLSSGQTVLTWTISNGPCDTVPLTDTVVITIFDNTQEDANAGGPQSFCEPGPIDTVMMFANEAVPPAVGSWSIDGSGNITDPDNRHTTVTDIGFGSTTLTWTIDNGVCGTSSDDVVISVFDINVPPAAGGPDQQICQDTTITVMAAEPAVSTATGHWELLEGHGDITHPDEPNTEITGLQPGTNIFRWVLDNGVCDATADTVLVILRDCSILVVPDAFSPNGDGVNDTYVIQGLDYYPDNSFQVFNRWGSKVYERNPYRNTWDGTSEGKLNWGTDLPESTYYFILDPGNDMEVITGYIYLRR